MRARQQVHATVQVPRAQPATGAIRAARGRKPPAPTPGSDHRLAQLVTQCNGSGDKPSGKSSKRPRKASSGKSSADTTKEPSKKRVRLAPDRRLTDVFAKYADPKARNRHEVQDSAMLNLAHLGSAADRRQVADCFEGDDEQVRANEQAITANVRLGGLNEMLRTADTPQAMLRSIRMKPGFRASQKTTSGGEKNWIQAQRDASAPTDYFIFRGTTPAGSGGGVIQDSHTNAAMKLGGKPTVGETSWRYHNDPGEPSLASIFAKSRHPRTMYKRLSRLHGRLLVTHPSQVRAVRAKDRAHQEFRTRKGATLYLDRDHDLDRFANIAAVRSRKVLTLLHRAASELAEAPSESDTDSDSYSGDVEMDADSEDEAERLFGKAPPPSKTASPTGKGKAPAKAATKAPKQGRKRKRED